MFCLGLKNEVEKKKRGKRAISGRATEILLYVHEVLVNRLGGLGSVVTLTGRPDMTSAVNRGRKTTTHNTICHSDVFIIIIIIIIIINTMPRNNSYPKI